LGAWGKHKVKLQKRSCAAAQQQNSTAVQLCMDNSSRTHLSYAGVGLRVHLCDHAVLLSAFSVCKQAELSNTVIDKIKSGVELISIVCNLSSNQYPCNSEFTTRLIQTVRATHPEVLGLRSQHELAPESPRVTNRHDSIGCFKFSCQA
jgi:hypothetical protein